MLKKVTYYFWFLRGKYRRDSYKVYVMQETDITY